MIGWGVSVNNQLVALQETVHSAWGQVETVLQRRYDLIPNLVNTVKGYAKHEKDVLEDVTRLRSQWGAAKTTSRKGASRQPTRGSLARLLLVAEHYPDLKASQNFRDLQYELEGTENRITVERQRYNDTVRAFLTFRGSLASIVAGMRGFANSPDAAYFKAAARPGGAESGLGRTASRRVDTRCESARCCRSECGRSLRRCAAGSAGRLFIAKSAAEDLDGVFRGGVKALPDPAVVREGVITLGFVVAAEFAHDGLAVQGTAAEFENDFDLDHEGPRPACSPLYTINRRRQKTAAWTPHPIDEAAP